ncbi:rhamnosyltransferase [compost metagenome]
MHIAVLLNYKTPHATINCANSIAKHCKLLDHIIIVDNNSEDESHEILESYAKEKSSIKFLQNHTNNGYAGGNNFAIRWALDNLPNVQTFWIINSDCLATYDAHSPLVLEHLENPRNFYGSIVVSATTGKLESYGGGKLYPLLGKSMLLHKGAEIDKILNTSKKPDYLMGCSLLVSKEIIDMAGLMDESYFMYSEEVDWQYRAKRNGIGIHTVRNSQILHLGSLSSGGKSEFYYFYRNRAAIMFNRRFYGKTVGLISALTLSLLSILQEIQSPRRAMAGVKGAISGLFKDFT